MRWARLLVGVILLSTACSGGGTDTADSPAATTPDDTVPTEPARPSAPTTSAPVTTRPAPTTTSTTTTTAPPARFGDARDVGRPYGSVEGVTMFRGNLGRSWYGTGPAPEAPELLWRYPDARMCGLSTHRGEPKTWCGTGWTGQPVIWERPDGITELIFGSYDKSVHFVDADTGEPTRRPFRTGDIVKGSVTLDPDGYPLLYVGSRDNEYRIVALDRGDPEELWSRNAYENRVVWNDDWDANAAIADDILFLGAESGWFLVFELGRSYDSDGLVTVSPTTLLEFPMFTDELLRTVGREQSVESSVVLFEERAYVANSAGRIVGLDISAIETGEAPVVFDFWVGEDVDATMVVDRDGRLYVAAEQERFNARGIEVGQLLKLDPTAADDPIVWSVDVPPIARGDDGGLWATPALGSRDGEPTGVLYAATHPGELLAVDTDSGEVLWRDDIGWHAWSSPIVVDDTLITAVACSTGGGLRGYDLSDPRRPTRRWEITPTGGCIESSPIIWDGRIYVGSRDGYVYALGDGPS